MSSTAYLLGAGASYACPKSGAERPPLTDDVLATAAAKGLLTSHRYPALWKSLENYLGRTLTDPADVPCLNVECFLSVLADQFEALAASLKTKRFHRERSEALQLALYQCSLGETMLLLYELLGAYKEPGECYLRLAQSCSRGDSAILTLNYDRLLEMAFDEQRIPYHYAGLRLGPTGTAIVKLHGSVTWLNSINGRIRIGDARDPLCVVKQRAWSNRFHLEDLVVQPPTSVEELAALPDGPYEPALIPPVGGHKDYGKVLDYDPIWRAAASVLSSAERLVIIGCSLRDEDLRLSKLVSRHARSLSWVIVSPSHDEIAAQIEKLAPTCCIEATFEAWCGVES